MRSNQSSGAVWKSRWTSWAPVPNKPTVSVGVKQHFNQQCEAGRGCHRLEPQSSPTLREPFTRGITAPFRSTSSFLAMSLEQRFPSERQNMHRFASPVLRPAWQLVRSADGLRTGQRRAVSESWPVYKPRLVCEPWGPTKSQPSLNTVITTRRDNLGFGSRHPSVKSGSTFL